MDVLTRLDPWSFSAAPSVAVRLGLFEVDLALLEGFPSGLFFEWIARSGVAFRAIAVSCMASGKVMDPGDAVIQPVHSTCPSSLHTILPSLRV